MQVVKVDLTLSNTFCLTLSFSGTVGGGSSNGSALLGPFRTGWSSYSGSFRISFLPLSRRSRSIKGRRGLTRHGMEARRSSFICLGALLVNSRAMCQRP